MRYEQTTGRLLDDDGSVIGTGWAGHLEGKNNPSMQNVKDVGPLPKGKYIVGNAVEGSHLGPLAFPLAPDEDNQMYGRGGFYIHGASAVHRNLSSDGCIIQDRPAREYIGKKIGQAPQDSPLRQLIVL